MIATALTSLDIAAGMVLPAKAELVEPRFSLRVARHGSRRERRSSGRFSRRSFARRAWSASRAAATRPRCSPSATALARREGLPVPIPATNVFSSEQDADESSWQELLVRHLGLTEWIRLEYTDELDLIGPYAQRVLKAHGLLWPANVHFHLPLLEAARGGAMLTGIGGDELFMAARRLRAAAVLTRAVRPRPRDALSLALAFAPRRVRRAVIARRGSLEAPWLRQRRSGG